MNWHDTILSIRQQPKYADLVRLAYFDADLQLNVTRFGESEEFSETLKLLSTYAPNAKTILDIGAGNGISSINLALKGYTVTVVEPDPSDTVGANAIRILQNAYQLDNMQIHENYAEEIGFQSGSFDVVYVRQAMHHAYELKKFVSECARVLKPGGILLTVRDHVIYNESDKKWFLEMHPLHKFYGGENAFTTDEYKNAMKEAGLQLEKELRFYDSPVNYFPITTESVLGFQENRQQFYKSTLRKKIGFLADIPGAAFLYGLKIGDSIFDEKNIPGRMYSYISRKI
ncbi:class I SAM-dependent methyltransferase [Dyadobacter sandarakinus]|uniref:Class I SAM-dependent methyltransferase n=1 Tax=Dyadobacter sandarakinus TaxID=2747268 RepID=A0ABX7ICZ1_9BACT|nr:class I SAM-dependent methyltransferase [Dyadobacter sandarakinus]QRR03397.1 class I SAM-dependent methyltransferase [Dyadobacter sandarakinus]